MKQRYVIIIGLVAFFLQTATTIRAAEGSDLSTHWKGLGSISVETPVVKRGGEVRLRYSITGSRGTAAGVKCVVVSPSGWTYVKHQSFNLRGGAGSTTFQLNAGGAKAGISSSATGTSRDMVLTAQQHLPTRRLKCGRCNLA